MFGKKIYQPGKGKQKNRSEAPSPRGPGTRKSSPGGKNFPLRGSNMYSNYLVPEKGYDKVRTSSDTIHCEKVLNDSIISLKKILLMHHAGETCHDMDAVERHVSDRSREVIDEELSRITTRLVNLQGPNPSHRVAAYSQLFGQLLDETEMVIFNEERRNGDLLRLENVQRKMESDRMQHMLAQELAAKDQIVASLNGDRVELESQVKALLRSNESLKHELGKVLQEQTHTHQHAVELRMQGLDYKAEVERRCERVLRSIQSRMGFVPAGIMKNIQHLRSLKAPGDPAYDTIRRFAYAEAMGPRGGQRAPATTTASGPEEGSEEDDGFSNKESWAQDPAPGSVEEIAVEGTRGGGRRVVRLGDAAESGSGSADTPSRQESSSPESGSDGNGGGSSPSISASGGRVSKWAEMIYEADGYRAGWNQNIGNGTGTGENGSNNGSGLETDDRVDPMVWSQWDEQLNAHLMNNAPQANGSGNDVALWGRRRRVDNRAEAGAAAVGKRGGGKNGSARGSGSSKSPAKQKQRAKASASPSMGRLRYGST